jgi:hypothetical protein
MGGAVDGEPCLHEGLGRQTGVEAVEMVVLHEVFPSTGFLFCFLARNRRRKNVVVWWSLRLCAEWMAARCPEFIKEQPGQEERGLHFSNFLNYTRAFLYFDACATNRRQVRLAGLDTKLTR